MIQLKELDHFGIDVSDLDRSRHFYCDVLGLKMIKLVGPPDDPEGLLLQCGTRNFALHLNPESRRDGEAIIENPRGKAHLAFKVSKDDFEKARTQFERLNIPTKGPVDWGGHLCLYFLDPDGNLLELINLWKPGLSWFGSRLRE
jgi:catechol 2,3-dioxygenase-like lactoylglutathione lyase family enzyme